MRVVQVEARHRVGRFTNVFCDQCKKRALIGQWIAYRDMELQEDAAYKRVLFIHIKCMKLLCSRAGVDGDEKSFADERRRIKQTGKLFSE